MTRVLLILALLAPGLMPNAACGPAASGQAGHQEVCATTCCCQTACCCVMQDDPVPVPEAPATPPRGSDSAPSLVLVAGPLLIDWTEPPSWGGLAAVDAGGAFRTRVPRGPAFDLPLDDLAFLSAPFVRTARSCCPASGTSALRPYRAIRFSLQQIFR